MRLTEDLTDAFFAAADVWFSDEGENAIDEMRAGLDGIGALYDEHGTLLRAIVEVATYDEEIATFWRGLLQRFVEASRDAASRPSRRPATRRAFPAAPAAFALTWMTERTFYQQMAQNLPSEELVEAMIGIWTRSIYGRV